MFTEKEILNVAQFVLCNVYASNTGNLFFLVTLEIHMNSFDCKNEIWVGV